MNELIKLKSVLFYDHLTIDPNEMTTLMIVVFRCVWFCQVNVNVY